VMQDLYIIVQGSVLTSFTGFDWRMDNTDIDLYRTRRPIRLIVFCDGVTQDPDTVIHWTNINIYRSQTTESQAVNTEETLFFRSRNSFIFDNINYNTYRGFASNMPSIVLTVQVTN